MKVLPLERMTAKYASNINVSNLDLKKLEAFYKEFFDPVYITRYFDGWEFDQTYRKFIDHSEECNIIWISNGILHINEKEFPQPSTLQDFINYCQDANIELLWSETAMDRIHQ